MDTITEIKPITIIMTEEQRDTLLQIIDNTQFIGKSAEAVVELKEVLRIAREKGE